MSKPKSQFHELANLQTAWSCRTLKHIRYLWGLSLADAARRLNIGPTSLAALEARRKEPPFSTILAAIHSYQVSLEHFVSQAPTGNAPKAIHWRQLEVWVRKAAPDEDSGSYVLSLIHDGKGGQQPFRQYAEDAETARFFCERYPTNLTGDRLIQRFAKQARSE